MMQRHTNRGFTLLEVLIAIVVLSIGLLGLAGLQANGMRQNHSSNLRSQATFLAYDIMDRIRANRQTALDNGAYNIDIGDSPSGSGLEFNDLSEWKTTLAASLPAGDGSVSQAGSIFTITIQWDDSRGAEPVKIFTTSTQL